MDDDFDPEALRPTAYQPDTEVTLGPVAGVCLVTGLLLLCGFFFWLGFSMGRRGPRSSPAAGEQPVVQSPAQTNVSRPKPAPQEIHHTPQPADTGSPYPTANSAQPVVRPALAASESAPAVALMVQIAAVSHHEDADVLVAALRRRGYAVTLRRDPADSMFHVQVGPFSSRDDAEKWRQKLLNDGYNAIVEP